MIGRAYDRSCPHVSLRHSYTSTERQVRTSASTINRSSHYFTTNRISTTIPRLPSLERQTQYPALEIFLDTTRRTTKTGGITMKTMFADFILLPWSAYRLKPGSPMGGACMAMVRDCAVHARHPGGKVKSVGQCDQVVLISLQSSSDMRAAKVEKGFVCLV